MHFTKRITFNDGMDKYRYTPQEISDQIKARGADAVYAFQVRNPLSTTDTFFCSKIRVSSSSSRDIRTQFFCYIPLVAGARMMMCLLDHA